MSRFRGHIVLLFALAAFLAGGCGRARVIPEGKLVDIYVDMFLADQWIRDNSEARRRADTTLFFDPVFEKYGYTFEDYDKSMVYYSAKPDKFSEIATAVTEKLRTLSKYYSDLLEARNNEMSEKNRYFVPADFQSDTIWSEARGVVWIPAPDSMIIIVPLDSIFVKAEADSLRHEADSIIMADVLKRGAAPSVDSSPLRRTRRGPAVSEDVERPQMQSVERAL